ncbi:MAG TPA: 50S ribosomal protein L11 methyltransferase [Chryseosolibacter sp.]|nr:50S ribosomal protein L11 methyltransferase [Chryseosolibacter sp.]
MHYTRLQVKCLPEYAEILMAELAEIGFETFMETENGFEAYVEDDRYEKDLLQSIKAKYLLHTDLHFSFDRIEKKNWNEEWERSYEPIIVDDRCLIRAEFHKPEKFYPYEVIITPKMSFGTGHHQTTYLMVKNQMTIDHRNARVMDAGCGTAILAIMACKLGAAEVLAFDIDEWSVTNGNENIAINGCSGISIRQGTILEVDPEGIFDIILANINKNVLLEEMKVYSKYMKPGSRLLISGFYTHDIGDLLAEASQHGLKEMHRDERETWACIQLEK